MNNTMIHYGVLGMHWGQRMDSSSRYKAMRKSGSTKEEARKKVVVDNLKAGKASSDGASKMMEESLKIHESIRGIKSAKRKEDLSQLSDADLKAKITRMNLEQQYANLNGNQVSKGQSYAKSTIEIAGSVLAIGSSAIGIAVAIKQLKGG